MTMATTSRGVLSNRLAFLRPISWKASIILALVVATCLQPQPYCYCSATSTSLASSSTTTKPNNNRWSLHPFGSLIGQRRNEVKAEGGSYDKSYALEESDFDDDDDDIYDTSFGDASDDDESILSSTAYTFRGGGARMSGSRRRRGRRVGLSTRTRRKHQRQAATAVNLANIHQNQQAMRQFRKLFRQKQRQFQESLYNLNSRFNYEFPKPPYNLWRLDPEPAIGKTTLTGKIFLLNIAMFGLQTIFPQITSMGAKRSDMIMEGRQLYRLLTPIFLHGGIGHLMANSYSLKSMGVNVERAFGQPRLMATYLVSGVMGNVFSAIQSPNPAVGASGAIFGLVGAYYTFLSRNSELFGYAGHMQKSALVETIGVNLLLGMTNPMIDNWGHIGGFIGGVGMAYLIGPKLYVARIPLGQDNLAAGGFGAGKVVIDRPMITFRTPEFIDEGFFTINDSLRNLGKRVTTGVRGLLNGGGQEYFLDKNVDISNMGSIGTGDSTVYRTLKDGIELDGNVNVTPSDGFRQDVSQIDPVRPKRRSYPKAGHSIRPRYGHLYR